MKMTVGGYKVAPGETPSPGGIVNDAGHGEELSRADFYVLFSTVIKSLVFDHLRFKPREKQFAILLASDSFGDGESFGQIDIDAWRLRLPEWRSNELKAMLENWRRAGWLTVDVTEKTFRLAPNQWPGWANVQGILRSERRQRPLHLLTEDDLHKYFAKISQAEALTAAKNSQEVTKFSQSFTKFSQPGEGREGNVPTFNRSTSERINVKRADCENFATSATRARRRYVPSDENVQRLRQAVRDFVGEHDWTHPKFWNCGMGYTGRIFLEEYLQLEGALAYCKSALTDKDSGITVGKTRGAMLWDQFQRLRKESLSHAT